MSNQLVKTIFTGALTLGMIVPTSVAGFKVLAAKMSENSEVPLVTAPAASVDAEILETQNVDRDPVIDNEVTETAVVIPEPTIAPALPVAPILPASSVLPIASPTPSTSSFPVASIIPGNIKEIEIEDNHTNEIKFEKHDTSKNEIDD
ncbi:MAG: hypothetical protein WCL07_04490 [bacterium]